MLLMFFSANLICQFRDEQASQPALAHFSRFRTQNPLNQFEAPRVRARPLQECTYFMRTFRTKYSILLIRFTIYRNQKKEVPRERRRIVSGVLSHQCELHARISYHHRLQKKSPTERLGTRSSRTHSTLTTTIPSVSAALSIQSIRSCEWGNRLWIRYFFTSCSKARVFEAPHCSSSFRISLVRLAAWKDSACFRPGLLDVTSSYSPEFWSQIAAVQLAVHQLVTRGRSRRFGTVKSGSDCKSFWPKMNTLGEPRAHERTSEH